MEWVKVSEKLPDFEREVILASQSLSPLGHSRHRYAIGRLISVTDFGTRKSYNWGTDEEISPDFWCYVTPPPEE